MFKDNFQGYSLVHRVSSRLIDSLRKILNLSFKFKFQV
jgi:hypothetical protein